MHVSLFTNAIQTYRKYLICLNIIIVNGMRYGISAEILSVRAWVILNGHDMFGCISTPTNMFTFITNVNTNWKSCTSVWQSKTHGLPHWLYWESMACFIITRFTLYFILLSVTFPTLGIYCVCCSQYVSQLNISCAVFWATMPIVWREPDVSEQQVTFSDRLNSTTPRRHYSLFYIAIITSKYFNSARLVKNLGDSFMPDLPT